MNEFVLKFPTIVELIDFSLVMTTMDYEINRKQLTMMAPFPKEDIDLALKSFKAVVLKAGSGI